MLVLSMLKIFIHKVFTDFEGESGSIDVAWAAAGIPLSKSSIRFDLEGSPTGKESFERKSVALEADAFSTMLPRRSQATLT